MLWLYIKISYIVSRLLYDTRTKGKEMTTENIIISSFKIGQEQEISTLIKKIFDEFVAPDFTDEGINFFYKFISALNILQRQTTQNTILTASIDSQIVGVIDTRDTHAISLLFVDKTFQGQGIARRLFRETMKRAIKENPAFNKVYVHASRYSIPIYEKFGFVKNGLMNIENGILYLPMALTIE